MLHIDPSLCIGCRVCVDTCPNEALDMAEGISQWARPEECMSCGICEAICKQHAITMDEDEDG